MTNCPNCGAPIMSSKCEYCGTIHKSVSLPVEMPIYQKDDYFVSDLYSIYKSLGGNRPIDRMVKHGLEAGILTPDEARNLVMGHIVAAKVLK